MKSIIFIACTVTIAFALTAFTYSSRSVQSNSELRCQAVKEIEPPIFSYSLGPQANNTITKERLYGAKAIADLIPEYSIQESLKNKVIDVRDTKISIGEENIDETNHRYVKGNGNSLSQAQLNLLKSTDYSSNFFLEGYTTKQKYLGDLGKDRYFNYYMTVVPEQQATYKSGCKAFIEFLSSQCQPTIAKVQKGHLKSGQISFTVTRDGTISDIEINATCGYPGVDKKMMELMNNLPEDWRVATNENGDKVEQTFVFSYGETGC